MKAGRQAGSKAGSQGIKVLENKSILPGKNRGHAININRSIRKSLE